VNRDFRFNPPVRGGILFNGAGIIILTIVSGWGLWRATTTHVGPLFLLYLLLPLLAIFLIPLLAYRVYALWRASYLIERDGFHLYWGLREESIPMDQVQWVRSSNDLDIALLRPRIRWPGAVLGMRDQLDGSRVEYLAAQNAPLILIATDECIFAITPDKPDEFLRISQQFAELGSLTPFPARSVHPAFLLAQVWSVRAARYLLVAGMALTLVLFGVASLVVPSHSTVSLRLGSAGNPADAVPSVQVLLLPIINSFFFLADVLLGLFFFRRQGEQIIAYILWGSSVFTSVLFLIALLLIMGRG
jgi:hypothetical protein